MARWTVRHEIDARRRRPIRGHATRIHAFIRPQAQQRASERVVADARHVSCARAQPRRGDHHVRRVAAKPAHIGGGIVGARRIELNHRLADGDDVRGRGGVGHRGTSVTAGRLGSARNAAA